MAGTWRPGPGVQHMVHSSHVKKDECTNDSESSRLRPYKSFQIRFKIFLTGYMKWVVQLPDVGTAFNVIGCEAVMDISPINRRMLFPELIYS